MARTLTLSVNDAPVQVDNFVGKFIDRTVSGIIASLKGTGEIKELTLSIEGDSVSINLNGENVPTNFFASKIIKSTLLGMIAPLKGVSRDVRKLTVSLHG